MCQCTYYIYIWIDNEQFCLWNTKTTNEKTQILAGSVGQGKY